MADQFGDKSKPARPPREDVNITLTITETKEGKLHVHAQIPDAAANTFALVLAEKLMEGARIMMNDVLDVDEKVERGMTQ